MGQLPTSVRRSIMLVRALVAWGVLATALTVLLRDELVVAWARGNQAAQEVLDEGGLEALKSSSIRIPGFAALTVTFLVVYAALVLVLVAFLRGGHPWSRVVLTATAAFTSFAIAVGLWRAQPPLFVGLGVVALGLNAALVWFLWREDTGRFLHEDVPAAEALSQG
ncbi:hypothetical protein [Nocardioides sp.]|uniref:hypothetical protein n=1 Tax=Nocardioides sp. TaxID=35761 RepID=UPI003529ABA4